MAVAGCTKQFCSYREDAEKIDGLDAEVLGISQDLETHRAWVEKHSLRVPLLSDLAGALGAARA